MRMSALLLNDNQSERFPASVNQNIDPPALFLVWGFEAGSKIE